MAVKVKVRLNKQIIVPVRFIRAVAGPPVIDAPDIDDRGFAMGTRPGTWGSSDARGPMVGITTGDTVRIKVLREDIDDTAPLFVSSTDTAILTVQAPAGGGPLAADGIFQVKGEQDAASRPVKIQVHLGTADGPVLGELEPHIYQLHRLRVQAHLVSINGTPTTRTAQTLVQLFQEVNNTWRIGGIEFQYDPAQTVQTPVNGLANAGQMTTSLPQSFTEFSKIINTAVSRSGINVYFVQAANEVTGLTFANDVARPRGFGLVIADSGTSQTVAHELCHYLDSPQHSDQNAAGAQIRGDIWTLRTLMFSSLGFAAQVPAHRNDVGYGANQAGSFMMVKDLPVDTSDGEVARARRRALNPF